MSRYVSYADNQAEELRASLLEEDIELLRKDLEQLTIDGWLDWAEKNQNETTDYLRATEKQRMKKKKWQEPVLRRRLVLGAYHQARLASSMLYAATTLGPGGGYRDTAAYAATMAFQVMKDGEWRWPFLDIDPPNGWPGPHFEPYFSATSVFVPGQLPKTETREGFDCT